MRHFATSILAILAVGCSSNSLIDTNRTLVVNDILHNIDELNGKRVKVVGFLPTCGGYDCGLFTNEQQAKDFWRIANDPKSKEKLPEFVEIGEARGFDTKAGPLGGHYVIVTGRVTNKCHGHGRFCTDRGPDLIPIDIIPSPRQPVGRNQP